jgi:hypothetical protein
VPNKNQLFTPCSPDLPIFTQRPIALSELHDEGYFLSFFTLIYTLTFLQKRFVDNTFVAQICGLQRSRTVFLPQSATTSVARIAMP